MNELTEEQVYPNTEPDMCDHSVSIENHRCSSELLRIFQLNNSCDRAQIA